MKGFPNQVADLDKLARAMQTLARLIDEGLDARDYSVFGEALVRAGVAGTGHKPLPVEEYIAEQRKKDVDDQSYRTTARGLRELFRLFRFIDDAKSPVIVAASGRQAAAFAGAPMDAAQVAFWRRTIRDMSHGDTDGVSHPYQVMLRLIARKPGIEKAMCALAFEARDDSDAELDRIALLADMSELDAVGAIGVKKSNWKNAVKVLPRFAEQLRDVDVLGTRLRRSYRIADAPGAGGGADGSGGHAPDVPPTTELPASETPERSTSGPRAPRGARAVTPSTVATAGTTEKPFDETVVEPESGADPAVTAELRADRLNRHNLLVKAFAAAVESPGRTMFEGVFDLLVIAGPLGILMEAKTLDGSPADEVARVREAYGQLPYYEVFASHPAAGPSPIRKVACFESAITDEHRAWLNGHNIGVVWREAGAFCGDALAKSLVGEFLKEIA